MVSFKDILGYYRDYKAIALFSITASSIFEIIDLFVPYSIGQILNVLSGQPVDNFIFLPEEDPRLRRWDELWSGFKTK